MRNLLEKSNELVVAIHDLRQPNDVRCSLHEYEGSLRDADVEALKNVFVALVGEIGGNFEPEWEPIDLDRARDSLELTLRFEMAYATQCVSDAEAADLAQRFFSHFEGGQAFVAAYDLTPATYQVTFIVLSDTMAGILYIEDED
ncbi:hypothetical protein EON80_04890 [bacterium]|nr:MAG: hypothetical protein EON80_04890 [bacterium]